MAWPGSVAPPGARPSRRRRGKGARRGTSTNRVMMKLARVEGVAAKPKKAWRDVVPRCPEHVDHVSLGFLTLSDLILYVDAQARRGRVLLKTVRLPKEKLPPGVMRVLAVRCKRCRPGCYCSTCGGWQWGFRYYLARRDAKCAHETATPGAQS